MLRFRIREEGAFFLTSTVVTWLPVFVEPATCAIITENLKHYRKARGLRIHAYVVMPTHIHLIISTDNDLAGVVRDLKKRTSKELVAHFTEHRRPPFLNIFRFCGKASRHPVQHQVWEEGSHPEQILSQPFFAQKADYIHGNPFRKGLVADPLAWRFSSARQFAGVPLDAGDGGEPLEVDWVEW